MTLLTIDPGSMAIGFISGLIFYIAVAIIIALVVARKAEERDDRNKDIYLKKLRESGYGEDIFE